MMQHNQIYGPPKIALQTLCVRGNALEQQLVINLHMFASRLDPGEEKIRAKQRQRVQE